MKIFSLYKRIIMAIPVMTISAFAFSKAPSDIKVESVMYNAGGVMLHGYVAYNAAQKGKRPAVLVVHEWWGLTDYPKMRARMLAESGYIAMAVDMFGMGKTAANPKEAQELTTPFYKDPQLAKSRLDAAIEKIKEFPETDPNNIAAIGYCFGGYIVLNAAKLGADLKGVASFHGGMGGAPVVKNLLKAKVLVCYGGEDKFVSVSDVDKFKRQLDSISVNNTFKFYPKATHAFTNPDATKLGKEFNMPIEYNPAADKDSWNELIVFLKSIFKK